MTLADTLRGLLRRWYIVLPGIILALAVAIGTFVVVKPGYERTATQLLLPGSGTIPEGATNPYLFLGSLAQAADIVVRAMGSDEVAGQVVEQYPGVEVQVSRDPLVSGPVILFTVTADSDADAAGAIDILLDRSAATLEQMQAEQGVRPVDQITSSVLTKDSESTLQQKNRLMLTAVVAGVLILLTLIVASVADGLSRRRRPNGRTGNRDDGAAAAVDEDDDLGMPPGDGRLDADASHDDAPLETEPVSLSDTQEIRTVVAEDVDEEPHPPQKRRPSRAKRTKVVDG